MLRFYLGTHRPDWLRTVDVPLFVSHRRLNSRKTLPVARGEWALDSGGFTELNMYGHWKTTVPEYIEAVERYAQEIGGLQWAAPMDWMCEPKVLAETGLTVREHQERTVQNYLDLRDHGPFVPVLQGQFASDYEACMELYSDAGVDLWAEPTIGLGTVCRRANPREITEIVNTLTRSGLRLHGFGMKSTGLARVSHLLASADSMAWSTGGRMAWLHKDRQLCRSRAHKGSCANCCEWAMIWRERVIAGLGLFAENIPDSEGSKYASRSL